MKKTLSIFRWIFALLIGVSVFVFISQNIAAIEVNFLNFVFETSRAALVGICVLAGFLVGLMFGLTSRVRL